jgi:hypothetical protein
VLVAPLLSWLADGVAPSLLCQGLPTPVAWLQSCLQGSNDTTLCPTLRYLYHMSVNDANTAISIILSPEFEPTSHFGATWLKAFRRGMNAEEKRTAFRLYLSGVGPGTARSRLVPYSRTPSTHPSLTHTHRHASHRAQPLSCLERNVVRVPLLQTRSML